MSKNDLTDMVMKDFKPAIRKALKETAEELAFEIENAYEKAIDAFYDDYDPRSYDRTYSTYLASTGYNDPFSPKNVREDGEDSYLAGIHVSARYMPKKPYRAKNKFWVFQRTYEKGIHGVNRNDAIERKEKHWSPQIEGVRLKNGIWQTKHGRTRTFFFDGQGERYNISRVKVKNMVPPPEKLMKAQFKQIRNQDHINEVFTRNLSNNL